MSSLFFSCTPVFGALLASFWTSRLWAGGLGRVLEREVSFDQALMGNDFMLSVSVRCFKLLICLWGNFLVSREIPHHKDPPFWRPLTCRSLVSGGCISGLCGLRIWFSPPASCCWGSLSSWGCALKIRVQDDPRPTLYPIRPISWSNHVIFPAINKDYKLIPAQAPLFFGLEPFSFLRYEPSTTHLYELPIKDTF